MTQGVLRGSCQMSSRWSPLQSRHVHTEIRGRHHTSAGRAFQERECWQCHSPRSARPDRSKGQAGGPYSCHRVSEQEGGPAGIRGCGTHSQHRGRPRSTNSDKLHRKLSVRLKAGCFGNSFDYRETAVTRERHRSALCCPCWVSRRPCGNEETKRDCRGVGLDARGRVVALGGRERDGLQGESRTRLGMRGAGRAANQLGEYTGPLVKVFRARNLNVKVTIQYRRYTVFKVDRVRPTAEKAQPEGWGLSCGVASNMKRLNLRRGLRREWRGQPVRWKETQCQWRFKLSITIVKTLK